MNVLLDTHAFLWWVADDPSLSTRARRILSDSSNPVFFSAVSGWEIAIKAHLRRLALVGTDIEEFVAGQVAINGFKILPVHLHQRLRPTHCPTITTIRLTATDCQAWIEGLALLSGHREFAKYDVRVVW